MSRISDGYEPDDTASFLRSCAFSHNVDQALKGKKGQKFLRELEAALIALPQKRLIAGVLARSKVEGAKFCGDVCALGAVALKRAVDAGTPREIALQELALFAGTGDEEEDGYSAWQMIEESSHLLKISMPLGYNVVDFNDEGGPGGFETPEHRYDRVLRWAQTRLQVVGGSPT